MALGEKEIKLKLRIARDGFLKITVFLLVYGYHGRQRRKGLRGLYMVGMDVGGNDEVYILEADTHRAQGTSQLAEEVLVAGVDKDPISPLDEVTITVIGSEGLPGKRVEIITKAHGAVPQLYG
jgi:hypothetical protein